MKFESAMGRETHAQLKTKVKVAMRIFAFSAAFSLSAVAAPNPDYVRDLSELLSIPSVSANKVENDRAIDWMQAFLEKRGVWCAVEQWPEDGRKVLYAATRPGLKNPDYTIVTHLDVVDAPAEQFKPRLVGSKLYARGACDTKSVAYAAAKILERLNGQASVGCVFSSNEEVGGSTTGYMVGLGYGVPGKMVFVFDCGGVTNQIRTACKGCAYYRITAYGKSGHASRPQACDNPFYKLARAALKIESEYPFQKPGEWGNVAAVTIVRGGDSQYRIPESAEMTVNARFVEDGGLEKERALLERLTGLKTELIRGTPAAVSKLDDPELVRLKGFLAERRPGSPVKIVRTSGANDSRYFPQFGKPMVGLGGVVDHGAHSDDEWVDVDTLGPHIDLMCDFLRPADASAGQVIRVGTYNVRYSDGDVGTPNAWPRRKDDLVALVKSLGFDIAGLQEVCPDQLSYLREKLPGFAFVGEHREAMLNGMRAWERCGARIDYVYVSPGVRVLDYATVADSRPERGLYPSDHFPIVATIEIPVERLAARTEAGMGARR